MNVKTFAATLALASTVLVPAAMADQWNKKTYITVNEAIQVPGKVLQPGRYVMRLLESQSNRHIVQIFNEREDQLQTTVLAIPNYRLQPTGKTEFQWWETPAGQPRALRAWFYPGDNFGQEFAYPKSEAMSIAASTNTQVPVSYAEDQANMATARVGTVDRAGTEMELDRQTYSRADGAQTNQQTQANNDLGNQQTERAVTERPRTEIAQNRTTTQDMNRGTVSDQGAMSGNMGEGRRGRQLPRTASPVPMAGLAGLLALGASLAVRAINRV
jgi:hypothetical protein